MKFAKEQFLSNPVLCLWTFPGISISASMILKLSNPKISFRTCSEWSVPDIMTNTLFCSISSSAFRLEQYPALAMIFWIRSMSC